MVGQAYKSLIYIGTAHDDTFPRFTCFTQINSIMVWCDEAGRGFFSLGSTGNLQFSAARIYSGMVELQKGYSFLPYERSNSSRYNQPAREYPSKRNCACQGSLTLMQGGEPRFDRSWSQRCSHWSEMGMQPSARELALPECPLCAVRMGWSKGWGYPDRCMQFVRCSRSFEWLCTQWAWAKNR